MTLLTRRSLLVGLGAALAAPAIVRFDSLMKVRGVIVPTVDEIARYAGGASFVDKRIAWYFIGAYGLREPLEEAGRIVRWDAAA